ncbi:YbaB/EbfC family nucleoid-associated protein [Frankia sp. QA3]|uniref:YbaB/EbfC family nucleoid-associated protein n=1 Tax=Frankia sp. QA3 TaxID=710111 RepID=UPI000269BBF5|nr:YbaB/EbfC family nucleoid-associated protein [Frankia sp. QA3]EIV92644.1 hypothetical protein FraQA3DRAFT_2237 [Frankia sp. QA3]
MDHSGRPDWDSLVNLTTGLRAQLRQMQDVQREMLQVTGTARSPDRLVKVVVGPRGQLVELDIDPLAYQRLNAAALAATILATAREAADQAMARGQELLAAHTPAELRATGLGALNLDVVLRTRDSDLIKDGGLDGLS